MVSRNGTGLAVETDVRFSSPDVDTDLGLFEARSFDEP
jgi:hypothetical protein